MYLVYGEELYLIDQYINELKDKYKNYDVVYYDLLESNISDAVDDALMSSLFSSNKLIICTNSFIFTGDKSIIEHNIDSLLEYMNNNNNNNIFIFVVNAISIDLRKKIVKEIDKNGTIKEFKKLKDYDLNKFIKDYISNHKYKIDNSLIPLIIEKLTNNLYVITSELDKLFIYKGNDYVITKEDVNNTISKVINSNIFDLINAIVKKDIDKSLELYDDLLLLNEEEFILIVALANQFRLIYQVKEMYKMGYSELDISKSLGNIHSYRIKLAHNVDITSNEALKYLRRLAKLDEDIKVGNIDKSIGFKKFILEI